MDGIKIGEARPTSRMTVGTDFEHSAWQYLIRRAKKEGFHLIFFQKLHRLFCKNFVGVLAIRENGRIILKYIASEFTAMAYHHQ